MTRATIFILLMFNLSCNPQKRLSNLLKKHPDLVTTVQIRYDTLIVTQTDTAYPTIIFTKLDSIFIRDTVKIETIKKVKEVVKQSLNNCIRLPGTLVVDTLGVRLTIWQDKNALKTQLTVDKKQIKIGETLSDKVEVLQNYGNKNLIPYFILFLATATTVILIVLLTRKQ